MINLGLIDKLLLQSDIKEIDIDYLIDSRGYNLLLVAAADGNAEIFKILLDMGMSNNILENNINAQMIAWNGKHFDVLMVLANENLTYPTDLDATKCTGAFKKFCNDTEELHTSITANDVMKVEEILEKYKNKNLKHFYNFINESALKVAIQNDALDVYEKLISLKFRFGPHESPAKYLEDLPDCSKRRIEKIHNKYSIILYEKHINLLTENSWSCHEETDAEKKAGYVQKAYQVLNSHILVRIILMVVAASKKYKIIYDFNRDAVNVLDPTTTSDTSGICYFSGRIYVGVKELLDNATRNSVLATMAHEFCHFAIGIVYRNRGKPYKNGDTKTEKEFEKITQICMENSYDEKIIGSVFVDYDSSNHHVELIVRVVHLMILYCDQPDKLSEVRNAYKCLFDFYENKVVNDMKAALKEMTEKDIMDQQKKDKKIFKLKIFSVVICILAFIGVIVVAFIVRSRFNKQLFDKLSLQDQIKIKNAKIDYKNCEIRFSDLFPDNSKAYEMLMSDHILKMLDGDKLYFNDTHTDYLNNLVNHSWEKMTKELKNKILNSNIIFQNENYELQNLNTLNPEILESLTSLQVIQILDGKKLIVNKIIEQSIDFYVDRLFDFEDMDVMIAGEAYERMGEINFENAREYCNYSLEFLDEFIDKFFSENITEYFQKAQEIKKTVFYDVLLTMKATPAFLKFSIMFKFEDLIRLCGETSFKFITSQGVDTNYVIQKVHDTKIFILSSEAGAGKTITFEYFTLQMKKKYPMLWVSYIDLKEHGESYNKYDTLDHIELFLEEILDVNPNDNFEKKIFQEFYKSGQVVLLWNGFDEIAPQFSDFIIKVIKHIKESTKNIQFVCTLPIYSQDLQISLNSHAYSLIPFGEQQRTEFLRKFFVSQIIKEQDVENLIVLTRNNIKKLESSEKVEGFIYRNPKFETPLMLHMIADLIVNDIEIKESENLYEIYQKFVEKKIQIWQERNEVSKKISNKLLSSGYSIISVYQKYALLSELKILSIDVFWQTNFPKFQFFTKKVPTELTNEEISRMGILYITGKSKIKFVHLSFADFFIAQFFSDYVFSPGSITSMVELESYVELFCFIAFGPIKTSSVEDFLYYSLISGDGEETKEIDSRVPSLMSQNLKNGITNLLSKDNFQIFDSIFKLVHKNHTVLVELFQVLKNETLYTATFNIHYYSFYQKPVKYERKFIKELGKKYLKDDEFKDLIDGKHQKGIILYSSYLFFKHHKYEVIHDNVILDSELLKNQNTEDVFELILKNLTNSEIEQLLFTKSSPIFYPNEPVCVAPKFFNIIQKTLSKDRYKEFVIFALITAVYMVEPARKVDILATYITKIEDLLSSSEIQQVIFKNNLLQIAATRNEFPKLWPCYQKHATKNQIKETLLLYIDISEIIGVTMTKSFTTPMYNIFTLNLFYPIRTDLESDYVINAYMKVFSRTEMQDIIIDAASVGFYELQLNYERPFFVEYLKFVKKIFKGNEIKLLKLFLTKTKRHDLNIFEYLKKTDETGNTIKIIAEYFDIAQFI